MKSVPIEDKIAWKCVQSELRSQINDKIGTHADKRELITADGAAELLLAIAEFLEKQNAPTIKRTTTTAKNKIK